MKRFKEEDCYTVKCGLLPKNLDKFERMWNRVFYYTNQLKNDFINYVWDNISAYAEKDKVFSDALDTIKNQNKSFGKAVSKNEQDQQVKEAYAYIRKIFYKDKVIDLRELQKEFKKSAKNIYKIYVADDVKSYALDNVLAGFKDFIEGNGKWVRPKSSEFLLGIQAKPYLCTDEETNETRVSSATPSMVLVYEGDNIYLKYPDYTNTGVEHIWKVYDKYDDKFKTNLGRCPKHKSKLVRVGCKEKDKLQREFIYNPQDVRSLKVTRYRKGGRWNYRLDVMMVKKSPVKRDTPYVDEYVGVNIGTEVVAIATKGNKDNKPFFAIVEMTPTTPRVFDDIIKYDVFMSNSRFTTNRKLFRKNGQVKYTKEEMRNQDLHWKWSSEYKKVRAKRQDLYRMLTEMRNINQRTLANFICSLGSHIILDRNWYKSWGFKQCRMSAKSKKRISKTQRGISGTDYTKQIHDRAPRKIRICYKR